LLNTTGTLNTATGVDALASNNGSRNTADGAFALFHNTTGDYNVAIGNGALESNTDGSFHTAIGSGALENCIAPADATGNTAVGNSALNQDTTGNFNLAIGDSALFNNTTGQSNTAIGSHALFSLTDGGGNIALGTGSGNAITTGDSNIYIGNDGVDGDSGRIRIGRDGVEFATFMSGIHGTTTGVADAIPVVIDSDGQLGTISSSARFKNEIKPMNKASEAILGLKPVTFHYKNDKKNTPQFGLIAEEVAKVNQDLVVRDKNGEIYTVRYDQVNAMLLNEFLKEHRKVEEQNSRIQQQEATISELKSTVAQQQKGLHTVTARLEQQAAQIQKVSAQLEASKPAPQMVNNP
jgi:uncharacterized coiled-coil protein SlyX